MVEISQNFVAFSEYMNFSSLDKKYEVKVHFWSGAKVVFRLNAHPRIQILNSLKYLGIYPLQFS